MLCTKQRYSGWCKPILVKSLFHPIPLGNKNIFSLKINFKLCFFPANVTTTLIWYYDWIFRSILTNSDIDLYNSHSESILSDLSDENPNRLVIWSSLARIADMVVDQMIDGINLPSRVVQQGVLVCNSIWLSEFNCFERHIKYYRNI